MANQVSLWSSTTCAGDTDQPAPETFAVAPVAPPAQPELPKRAALVYTGSYDPFWPDRDCSDVRTHAEAQAFFMAAGGPTADRHHFDADYDGVACETLP